MFYYVSNCNPLRLLAKITFIQTAILANDASIANFFERCNRLEKDEIVSGVVFPSAQIWQRHNFRRDI
jgi:hypothetical protein